MPRHDTKVYLSVKRYSHSWLAQVKRQDHRQNPTAAAGLSQMGGQDYHDTPLINAVPKPSG